MQIQYYISTSIHVQLHNTHVFKNDHKCKYNITFKQHHTCKTTPHNYVNTITNAITILHPSNNTNTITQHTPTLIKTQTQMKIQYYMQTSIHMQEHIAHTYTNTIKHANTILHSHNTTYAVQPHTHL